MDTKTNVSALEECAIVERVARIVSTVRGNKPDYSHLAAELAEVIPFDVIGIVLLSHDRKAVRLTVCHRERSGWVAKAHQHPFSESMASRLFARPQVIATEYPSGIDGLPHTSGDSLVHYHLVHSALIVPLKINDRVLGTLELGSFQPGTYQRPGLQRLAGALTDVLAAAIDSVQMGGNIAIQDRQREALKTVSHSLTTSSMQLNPLLQQLVDGIATSLGAAAIILLIDRYCGALAFTVQSGLQKEEMETLWKQVIYCSDDGIIGQTIKLRQQLISTDIQADTRFFESRDFFASLGMSTILCSPLYTDSVIYGALLVCSPETGGFTPLKCDIVGLFASQATIAIHNGLLLEAAQQRRYFQGILEELDKRIHDIPADSDQSEDDAQILEQEFLLFKKVRHATRKTFGMNFGSLLRYLSDYLYTNHESEWQRGPREPEEEEPEESMPIPGSLAHTRVMGKPITSMEEPEEAISLLTRTAAEALARAGAVGELGRLLSQHSQSASGIKDAWFVIRLDGFCAYMNPAGEQLCGLRLPAGIVREERATELPFYGKGDIFINELFGALLPRIRNEREFREYLRSFKEESVQRHEMRCILSEEPLSQQAKEQRPNDLLAQGAPSDRHYHCMRYPLYDQQGSLIASALRVQDVTEQVRDEKNRSALLSAVSHDLRTPLTTIKAAVSGLLQPELNWSREDIYEVLEDIDYESDHLTVLVNALIDLARIQTGALELEKEWCDPVEVIDGARTKARRILENRHVEMQVNPTIQSLAYLDHAQIGQVVYNLLENAILRSKDHTTIWILLDTFSAETEMLRVQILDQGAEIPEQEREKIFRTFHRLRSYGNALGLAICEGIVEAHQGQIWVESAQGIGVEATMSFAFVLPVHHHTSSGALEQESAARMPAHGQVEMGIERMEMD